MTPDELKAELAQLAAENTRLREAAQQVLTGKDCPFCDALRFRTLDQKHWPECGTLALQDAITPPTPGLGAAMLRVVKAAKAEFDLLGDGYCFCVDIIGPASQCSWCDLTQAIQALNELEGKRE